MNISYPYRRVRNRWVPVVPVILFGDDVACEVDAYVDPGSFRSVFEWRVAEELGLVVSKGKRDIMYSTSRSKMTLYLHRLKIALKNDVFRAELAFSKELQLGFNILGLDVLKRYATTFDGRCRRIVFHR